MIEFLSRLRASEPVRLYLYAVGLAVLGLLVGYGIVDGAQAPLWLALLVALLGVPATEAARRAVRPTSPPSGRRRAG